MTIRLIYLNDVTIAINETELKAMINDEHLIESDNYDSLLKQVADHLEEECNFAPSELMKFYGAANVVYQSIGMKL